MKKTGLLLLFVLVLVSLFSCNYQSPDKSKKISVATFTAMYKDLQLKSGITDIYQNTGMNSLDSEKYFTFYDITPKDVFDEIGCQIFKVNFTCESYIVYNGKPIHIAYGFGGYGLVDIKTCNFDGNSKKDLIYTYSWGSGIHRSLVGVFNFTKMQEQTLDYQYMDGDMMIDKKSDDKFDVYATIVKPKSSLDYSHFTLTEGKLLKQIIGDKGVAKYI